MMHYLPSVIWFLLIPFVLQRNIYAMRVYAEQKRLAEQGIRQGVLDEGYLLVARNQLFRYRARTAEGIYALGIGVLGVISLWRPDLIFHPWYTWVLLGYLYFGPAVTGFMTHLDLKVTKKIMHMDDKQ